MPVRPEILEAVKNMGFEAPSQIQEQAIAVMLEGRDIIGQAQTGTGKTAAFGIPMLQMIGIQEKKVQGLVLCPTRELAIQVAEELKRLGKYLSGLGIVAIYGGQAIDRQIQELKRGVQIVVGTPGRIKDHMSRQTLSLNSVSCLVLDEADEMLNMGFREEIEGIIEAVPPQAQRACFSATMPESIRKLCCKYLAQPKEIKIARPTLTVAAINQSFYEIRPYRKLDALVRLLEWEPFSKALVFCSTKKMVDELAAFTQNKGIAADALHGDLAQSQRDRVMGRYRSGELRVLIATDVAARGLDVDDVDLVINFDLPFDHESYVHRVGRTGRAGRAGRAVTIISSREYYKLQNIMRFTKAEIVRAKLPSFRELLEAKTEVQLEKLKEELSQARNWQTFEGCLDKLGESDYRRVSAALLRLLLVSQMGEFDENRADDVDDMHEAPYQKPQKRRFAEVRSHFKAATVANTASRGKGERRSPFALPGGYHRKSGEQNMVSLLFNIGKKSGITPGDLVGMITNLGGITGKEIGKINLTQEYALVDIERSRADKVVALMSKIQIRGRKIRVDWL